MSLIHQQLIEAYLSALGTLNQHIKVAVRRIRGWANTDSQAKLLISMPGIGPYSAAVIVAEIAEIQRFERAKELYSFAGLVPSTRSSDNKTHHGRITKQGSSWLRWIMISASQRAGCRSPRLKTFYDRIAIKHGRKTARVALARNECYFLYVERDEPFIEDYQQGGIGERVFSMGLLDPEPDWDTDLQPLSCDT